MRRLNWNIIITILLICLTILAIFYILTTQNPVSTAVNNGYGLINSMIDQNSNKNTITNLYTKIQDLNKENNSITDNLIKVLEENKKLKNEKTIRQAENLISDTQSVILCIIIALLLWFINKLWTDKRTITNLYKDALYKKKLSMSSTIKYTVDALERERSSYTKLMSDINELIDDTINQITQSNTIMTNRNNLVDSINQKIKTLTDRCQEIKNEHITAVDLYATKIANNVINSAKISNACIKSWTDAYCDQLLIKAKKNNLDKINIIFKKCRNNIKQSNNKIIDKIKKLNMNTQDISSITSTVFLLLAISNIESLKDILNLPQLYNWDDENFAFNQILYEKLGIQEIQLIPESNGRLGLNALLSKEIDTHLAQNITRPNITDFNYNQSISSISRSSYE